MKGAAGGVAAKVAAAAVQHKLVAGLTVLAIGFATTVAFVGGLAITMGDVGAATCAGAGMQAGDPPPPGVNADERALIKTYLPLYQGAAERYQLGPEGPAVLAAINRIETHFGQNLSTSTAGAQGWMQFMPGTWRRYAVDANGDGRADPNSPADAIYTAAHYLQASGAPGDWHQAIFAYNHAEWYVADVWSHAQVYAANDWAPAGSATVLQVSDAPSNGPSETVAATTFGGPGDSKIGYRGDRLAGTSSFAELGGTDEAEANLLGHLPYMTALRIVNPATGQSVIAYKRDFGFGQGSKTLDGHRYAIDIWHETAAAIGLHGAGLVEVQRVDGGGMATLTSQDQAACQAMSVVDAGSPVRQRIVEIADSQIGVREQPPGSNCTPYGFCDQWCAMFTTWVWDRAGLHDVRVAANYKVSTLRAWAQAHGLWRAAPGNPLPGDMVVYSDAHVALVERVLPDGQITTVNGNGGDNAVSRDGPADPVRDWRRLGPAPITGYVVVPDAPGSSGGEQSAPTPSTDPRA
jgi:Transglycosylase SLT domain/CHAP domain